MVKVGEEEGGPTHSIKQGRENFILHTTSAGPEFNKY